MSVNHCADETSIAAKPGLAWRLHGLIAVAVTAWSGLASAADPPADPPEQAQSREQTVPNLAEQISYPRVTVSICYEVDPHWPKRPEGMAWGQTPGVFVDRQDRVWVYTRALPPVQVYEAKSGKLLFAWGEEVFGKYLDRMLAHQIKIDHRGHVWLADVGNHAVFELDSEGKLLRILGTPGEPGCDESHFYKPTDMVVSPQGDVFVSDGYGNARVVHFDARGRFVKAWGELGVKPGQFSLPHAIAMDSWGRLYVADRNNARVQVFEPSGNLLAVWDNLIVPWGFCMLTGDQLWVCGSSPMPWRKTDTVLGCPPKDQVFMRFDTSGRVQQLWTVPLGETGKEKPGELNWLHGIGVDSQGNIYATDIHGKRVQKFVRQSPLCKVPFVPETQE